jgi:GH18 family chitinase
MLHAYAISLILVSLCAACAAAPTPTPLAPPAPSATPKPPFRIVGYITDTGITPSTEQIAALTHINYAFALPGPEGALKGVANDWKLKDIVARASARGVKTLISIGGWGTDAAFERMAENPDYRARFVRETRAFVDLYGLDGVDIDWEYPVADPSPNGSAANFSALMQALSAVLRPDGKLLTMAVVTGGRNAEAIKDDVLGRVDFANIMVYDGGPGEGHSPYALAESALAYWEKRGLPASKRVLGVPFYAKPGDVPYARLVAYDDKASTVDSVEFNGQTVFYNGIPTLQRKVALAQARGSGIMFWHLGLDVSEGPSLLKAIAEAARR